jgi:hypothetical protein
MSLDNGDHHLLQLAATKLVAYWSAKCTNGKSYAVRVSPRGEGKIIESPILEALYAGPTDHFTLVVSAGEKVFE